MAYQEDVEFASCTTGHLPGTGGGLWTPNGTVGTPRDWVGRGAWEE